jgi:hypothetical protein
MKSHQGCLNGPALAAAIVGQCPAAVRRLSPADRRAIRRGAHGTQARIATADRILLELGLPLAALFEHCCDIYDNGRRGCGRRATS